MKTKRKEKNFEFIIESEIFKSWHLFNRILSNNLYRISITFLLHVIDIFISTSSSYDFEIIRLKWNDTIIFRDVVIILACRMIDHDGECEIFRNIFDREIEK